MLITVTPGRHWANTTDCAVMAAHWSLSSAMGSCDGSDWPVHSLMKSFYDVRDLLCDDDLPQFHAVWFSATYRFSRHDRTTIVCEVKLNSNYSGEC